MNKIYITNNLFNFSTKTFPENTLIFNILKFNNNNILKNYIEKFNPEIICENTQTQNFINKILPNKPTILIKNYPDTKYHYIDKSTQFFLYYILLSSFSTFFLLNIFTTHYSSIIFITLLINLFLWFLSYKFLINKQPWQPISIHN